MLYFSSIAADGKEISLGPLTSKKAAAIDPPPSCVAGYWLLETVGSDHRVLARVDSDDAAFSLARMLGLG
jgi:hypothetical protein